jgi:zinc D-Ala-D-Ala carboxypeptidase
MKTSYVLVVAIAVMSIWGCKPENYQAKADVPNAPVAKSEMPLAVDNNLNTAEVAAEDNTKLEGEEMQKMASNDAVTEKKDKHSIKLKDEKGAAVPKSIALKTVANDFSMDYLMGKFNPNSHPDFTTIKSVHASGDGMTLRKDAYASFEKMYNAALKDGVRLKIISATRPFEHQKNIWEAKWFGKRPVNGKNLPPVVKDEVQRAKLILMYSSMPGTSRHHWGTDIDLNDLNNPYFEKGVGKQIYDWLVAHAHEYGYCQVYSTMGPERPNGYQEEKWHWSYLPVSRRLTEQYKAKIKNTDIQGFEGSNTAVEIDMVNNYVLGINKMCK